jgi:hypothetical protein
MSDDQATVRCDGQQGIHDRMQGGSGELRSTARQARLTVEIPHDCGRTAEREGSQMSCPRVLSVLP